MYIFRINTDLEEYSRLFEPTGEVCLMILADYNYSNFNKRFIKYSKLVSILV